LGYFDKQSAAAQTEQEENKKNSEESKHPPTQAKTMVVCSDTNTEMTQEGDNIKDTAGTTQSPLSPCDSEDLSSQMEIPNMLTQTASEGHAEVCHGIHTIT